VARAFVQLTPETLRKLRKDPGKIGDENIPASLLKHADDQTVVGLVAVIEAIHHENLDPATFAGWGVIAAPRFLGRTAFETSFPVFQAEGAWGVSPHLISQNSLHSLSGTISQALKAHGPNLGIGGSPGAELEAFLAAATFLTECPPEEGVWLVLTGWNTLREDDVAPTTRCCEALALGLVISHAPTTAAPQIRIAPGLAIGDAILGAPSTQPLDLAQLADWVASSHVQPSEVVAKDLLHTDTTWRFDEPHERGAFAAPRSGRAATLPRQPGSETAP
jgi:hypothetical protein